MTSASPRLLLIDENVRDTGGHYLELAMLLMDGARRLGLTPTLATNRSFAQYCPGYYPGETTDEPQTNSAVGNSDYQFLPVFRSRRLNQWSLGVDGRSHVKRDLVGRPVGEGSMGRLWHQVRDPMSRRERRPGVMLREWTSDFVRLLDHWRPKQTDSLLINTADDFVMLALANGLMHYDATTPLQVRAVFHFAIFESNQISRRAIQFGQQVNEALRYMSPHDVSLYATTHSLANQLEAVGVDATAVPYPTRARDVPDWTSDKEPLKILMAGMPRAEKGREQIPNFLSSIYDPYLATGQFCVSMQMRQAQWQRLIPESLHADYIIAVDQEAGDASQQGALEIVSTDLPGEDYHRWLGTADVGLFLYDPVRYVARCSGVLLEMFIGGVPVIVPADCWLADQVQAAGGNGGVGYIYQTIEEIPELLREVKKDYQGLRARAQEHAQTISKRHSGDNTLSQMGVVDLSYQHRRAS